MAIQKLESDIEVTRAEIARLKEALVAAFGTPADFVALGDALRHASSELARLEAERKDLMLESREEVWWRSSRRGSGAAIALPKSAAVYRKRKAR